MAGSSSRQLLHKIALATFALMLGTGIVLRDVEALVFSVAVLGGILVLPLRKGLLGRIVLALVFVDIAFWMVPAAVSNVRHGDELAYVALPVVLAFNAVIGITAAVGIGLRVLPVVAGLVAVGTVVASQFVQGDADRPADLVVAAKNVRFEPERLTIVNGDTSVRFKNRDLFWHTFTIEALGVDLYVPVGATRRASFEAPAGEYEFTGAIPGHESAGMTGTLVVR